ncbi:MAG: sugar transferase, partial [Prevotella sp.]|nr:sugar transferase [Prevotella sp.]
MCACSTLRKNSAVRTDEPKETRSREMLTSAGKVLKRLHLDGLPQFFQVLLGD